MLLNGGHTQDPAVVWAVAAGLEPDDRPRTGQLDLLAGGADGGDPADPEQPVRADGYLRPGWSESGPPHGRGRCPVGPGGAHRPRRHARALAELPDPRRTPGTPPLALLTAWSESAAELLAVELGSPACRWTGRPRRARVGPGRRADPPTPPRRRGPAGPRRRGAGPGDRRRRRRPAQPRAGPRAARPGSASTCRTPGPGGWSRSAAPTRWSPHCWTGARRSGSPRPTATAGWTGPRPDGRLRGSWTGCDGAAGRMTASAGLHNMPAELRPAVVAEPGHVLSAPTSVRSSHGC